MARPVKIGVQLPEVEYEVGWPELIAMAQTAEAVGFDSIWVGDHLLYDLPIGPRGPWEAFTSLAALAAATKTITLGPLVAATAFRSPALLAKQAATVDAIAGGRLVLGLGAGWNRREFAAYGYPFDHRADRFEEAFTIVRELLQTGRSHYSGRWYQVDDCVLHPRGPRAASGGPPLMIGSVGPRVLHATLPHVAAWNTWCSDFGNTPDGFAQRSAEVDNVCASVGRDPTQIERSAAIMVALPDARGRRQGEVTVEPISGSAAHIAGAIRAFGDAGTDHLQLVLDPITRASIERLAEVLDLLEDS